MTSSSLLSPDSDKCDILYILGLFKKQRIYLYNNPVPYLYGVMDSFTLVSQPILSVKFRQKNPQNFGLLITPFPIIPMVLFLFFFFHLKLICIGKQISSD